MLKNLKKTKGLYNSQQLLLTLTQKGLSREKSYSIVQKIAMDVWSEDNLNFMDKVKSDKKILSFINKDELLEIENLDYHTKHVDYIFQKVFET